MAVLLTVQGCTLQAGWLPPAVVAACASLHIRMSHQAHTRGHGRWLNCGGVQRRIQQRIWLPESSRAAVRTLFEDYDVSSVPENMRTAAAGTALQAAI
jgi:hypothetical protein